MIKTYRGMLADDGQDHIRLKTNKGDIGYRIVNFNVIGDEPGGSAGYESVVQIWRLEQSSITAVINFTDGDLLGVGMWSSSSDTKSYPDDQIVIFDKEIFNQDIYITHAEISGSSKNCNYYLELEQVKLTENESTMATLQSLRRFALPRN